MELKRGVALLSCRSPTTSDDVPLTDFPFVSLFLPPFFKQVDLFLSHQADFSAPPVSVVLAYHLSSRLFVHDSPPFSLGFYVSPPHVLFVVRSSNFLLRPA